jgi:hypothetical protein
LLERVLTLGDQLVDRDAAIRGQFDGRGGTPGHLRVLHPIAHQDQPEPPGLRLVDPIPEQVRVRIPARRRQPAEPSVQRNHLVVVRLRQGPDHSRQLAVFVELAAEPVGGHGRDRPATPHHRQVSGQLQREALGRVHERLRRWPALLGDRIEPVCGPLEYAGRDHHQTERVHGDQRGHGQRPHVGPGQPAAATYRHVDATGLLGQCGQQ